MSNSRPISAFQCELELPEGVTLTKCELTGRKRSDHSISFAKLPSGNYQLTALSLNSLAFSGTDGALVNLTLAVSKDMAEGSYTVTVKNIELTTTSAQSITPADASATLTIPSLQLGDVNVDGKVTITDAVAIVNYILNNPPATFDISVADVNGDNKVSITDAVAIVNMILAGQNEANIREADTLPRIADTLNPE